jgi:hypothetical protein
MNPAMKRQSKSARARLSFMAVVVFSRPGELAMGMSQS